MRKSTMKRMMMLFLSLVMIIGMALPASAADAIDVNEKASLTVDFKPEGISATDVKFELFKIASVDEYSALTLTDKFKNLSVDLSDPDVTTWESAVTAAESYISTNSVKADYKATTNEDGVAVFSELPVGLYLIRGASFIYNHDVYAPQAYLIMLPDRDSSGKWNYDVTTVPKYEKRDELMDLTVTKKWKGGKVEYRPEEITVILYCSDTDFDTVVLNKENNWKYTWPQLNAKLNWTVSEVSVEGYETTIEPKGYNYVITNTYISQIPQTGMLWWPVPVLALTGVVFCLAGVVLVKKKAESK